MEENKVEFGTGYKSLEQCDKRKGGFRASMFLFVLVALENMGFVANMASMVLYFLLVMHFDLAGSANTLTNLMGSIYLLSVFGGFISDTYLTRFNTCLIFGTIEVLALGMFTIQAHIHKLQPEACSNSPCVKGGKALMFYSSLCLLALGAGAMRGAIPALGGDQFDQKDEKGKKSLSSFFNWLLLSTTLGSTIGVTVIVWISMNKGWDLGFLIITLATFLGFVVLAIGKPFFHIETPGDSPIIRVIQVIVVAIRNRRLSLPDNHDELYDISEDATINDDKIQHTNQFRSLDKAAILRPDSSTGPWKVCTVTQVEEVKILTRMLPILASTIIVNTCLAQLQTFSVQQGNIMDLHLGSFKIPPASIPVIPLLFMAVLLPFYELIFVPLARKITNHASGITQLQRVGVGLFLAAVSMGIAGIIEVKRRHQAIKDPTKPISLFWLSFQYGIFGIADMFTLIGLLEFYYKEASSGMRSLATSFTYLSMSIGYFLSSIFVDLINSITKRTTKSKQGWLQGQDLNKSNLNLFYWFLAILSCLNLLNYLYWSSWYKYKTDTTDYELKEKAVNGSTPFLKVGGTQAAAVSKQNGVSPART
ncbi:hypothetical protein AQUCO_00300240v1 [Aquilegia coerulea]|uniref:Major facilitator superfamily (MFS) profile domain-containing protein n=2 Tax=Aquilegia coerulea TaxID=218851 RepID=A0A2G5EY03_AQUCA|nr:hypothetical protein AQUCO_00300240v1 [Aquilegia coerulea]